MARAKKKKHILHLCRDYFGFGITLVSVGVFFLFGLAVTTFSALKLFIALFFLVLGAIDLILYKLFGER
jgi:hypothetical protein